MASVRQLRVALREKPQDSVVAAAAAQSSSGSVTSSGGGSGRGGGGGVSVSAASVAGGPKHGEGRSYRQYQWSLLGPTLKIQRWYRRRRAMISTAAAIQRRHQQQRDEYHSCSAEMIQRCWRDHRRRAEARALRKQLWKVLTGGENPLS